MGIALLVMATAMLLNIVIAGGFKGNISLFNFLAGGWISIVSLAIYLILFCIGFATQPWTICSEIFPSHLSGIAYSICSTSNWLFNYLLSSLFLIIT